MLRSTLSVMALLSFVLLSGVMADQDDDQKNCAEIVKLAWKDCAEHIELYSPHSGEAFCLGVLEMYSCLLTEVCDRCSPAAAKHFDAAERQKTKDLLAANPICANFKPSIDLDKHFCDGQVDLSGPKEATISDQATEDSDLNKGAEKMLATTEATAESKSWTLTAVLVSIVVILALGGGTFGVYHFVLSEQQPNSAASTAGAGGGQTGQVSSTSEAVAPAAATANSSGGPDGGS